MSYVEPDEPEEFDGDEWTELQARISAADDDLRRLGLYVEHSHPVPGQMTEDGKTRASIICLLGQRVAFGDRVQHPENFTVDAEFRRMMTDSAKDEWLDKRNELMRQREQAQQDNDND